jgi:hypothetical protein
MASKPQKQPNDKSPDAQRLIGKMSEEEIDYNVMGSFPASDPPSWTLGIGRRKKSTDEFEGEKISANEPSHQNELF